MDSLSLFFLEDDESLFTLRTSKIIVTDPDQGIIMYDHRMPLLALKIENRTLPELAICRMLGVIKMWTLPKPGPP